MTKRKTPRKLYVSELCIEVTRRCDLACEFCLRGDAQQTDLDVKLLDGLLRDLKGAGVLTLSGGEPSLAVGTMRRVFDKFHRKHIPFDGFFVATNGHGKARQERLAVLLLNEYMQAGEPDICSVSISHDQYHDWFDDGDRSEILRGLKFYSDVKEVESYDSRNTIPQGRAERNGLAEPENMKYQTNRFVIRDYDDDTVYVENLYVSANGFVYPCPNLSYETMDSQKICRIRDCAAMFSAMADRDEYEHGHRFF